MIVDSSAIAALFLREPEADRFRKLLQEEGGRMAAPTYLELLIVLQNKKVTAPQDSLDAVLAAFNVEVVPFTAAHARLAQKAYLRYGRGSGHPAKLNFGDCVSYSLAKVTGEPLLFKGDDFTHTDLVPA